MILVTSRERAALVLGGEHPTVRVDAVVSIGEFRGKPPKGFTSFTGPKLRLTFDDVDVESNRFGYRGATLADVEALIRFAEVDAFVPTVLVHCGAGVSRSSAAALVILAVRGGVEGVAGRLREAVRETIALNLRSVHAGVYPNRRVVALADECRFGGDLTRALAELEDPLAR